MKSDNNIPKRGAARILVVALSSVIGVAVSLCLGLVYSTTDDYGGWRVWLPIIVSLAGGLAVALGVREVWLKAVDEARLIPTMLWSVGLAVWAAFSFTALMTAIFYPAGDQVAARILGVMIAFVFCVGVGWTLSIGEPGRAQTAQIARWLLWEVGAGAGLFTVTTPLRASSTDLQAYGALLGGFWVVAGSGALLVEPLRHWYAVKAERESKNRESLREAREIAHERWARRAHILREAEYRLARIRRRR